jgi:hypothetical protein
LLSLAIVALERDWVKPNISNEWSMWRSYKTFLSVAETRVLTFMLFLSPKRQMKRVWSL